MSYKIRDTKTGKHVQVVTDDFETYNGSIVTNERYSLTTKVVYLPLELHCIDVLINRFHLTTPKTPIVDFDNNPVLDRCIKLSWSGTDFKRVKCFFTKELYDAYTSGMLEIIKI